MNQVCPRCGTAAAEHRFCHNCGLALHELEQLPTREVWERQVLAAARDFAYEAEPKRSRPSRFRRAWLLLPLAVAIGAIATVAVLVAAEDSPTETASQEPRRAADRNLVVCARRWNGDQRILSSGYAKGAETAFVVRDGARRCVVALPGTAGGTRSGFATFVRVEGGFWGSYANNPPKSKGGVATGDALAQAKEWEKTAAKAPNADVRANGTIAFAGG